MSEEDDAVGSNSLGSVVGQSLIHDKNESYSYKWDKSSCPCCFFSGGNKNFLPASLLEEQNIDVDDVTLEKNQCDYLSKPGKAWSIILQNDDDQPLNIIVDTHCHAHLEGDSQYCFNNDQNNNVGDEKIPEKNIMVLTCAVSSLNWSETLDYAANHTNVLPALGIHPWYIPDIINSNLATTMNKDGDIVADEWLVRLEELLKCHPSAFVGEIGLCRMAKYVRSTFELGGKQGALELQKQIFQKQLQLAAKYRRPVTVHCVKMHAALISILTDIRNDVWSKTQKGDDSTNETMRLAFPPAIALHSFTGSHTHVQDILKFEQSLWLNGPHELHKSHQRKQQLDDSSTRHHDPIFYFGFSHCINYLMCSSDKSQAKGMETVQEVPHNRILAESDVHSTNDVSVGTAGAIAYIHHALSTNNKNRQANLTFMDVARLTTANGMSFFKSLGQ